MKTMKTISLLTERIENGNVIREYQTFTLKDYERMLKMASNIENKKSNSTKFEGIKGRKCKWNSKKTYKK